MAKVKSKVGLPYGTPSFDEAIEDLKNGDFVASCDGVTFGVFQGKTFNTSSSHWPKDQQIRWATGNAIFFNILAKKLARYADVVEKEGNAL